MSRAIAFAMMLGWWLMLPVSYAAEPAADTSPPAEALPVESQSVENQSAGSQPATDAKAQNAPDADAAATAGERTLDQRVQDLKQEVKELNRDLFILEEELLFPSSTQLAVFLSIDVGTYFRLDSVQLKIDDKVVANHLYTKREVDALARGGVQRLYLGNVKAGEHELIAVFSGPGPNDREYRRGTTIKFEKGSAAKYLELRILDVTKKLQPEFVVKEWE